MEKLSVKLLLLAEPGRDKAENSGLGRHECMEIRNFPYCVKCAGRELFRLSSEGNGILLETDGILVNGSMVKPGQRLHSGDCVAVEGYEFGLYVQYESRALSRSSVLMSRLSKVAVILFVLLELWIMGLMPSFVSNSGLWESTVMRQQMNGKLDSLLALSNTIHTDDQMKNAYVKELRDELRRRARYVRMYETGMRRRQRREMYSFLQRLEKILLHLKENKSFGKAETPDVDSAVKSVIGI